MTKMLLTITCFISIGYLNGNIQAKTYYSVPEKALNNAYNQLRKIAQQHMNNQWDGQKTWAFVNRYPMTVPSNISITGKESAGIFLWTGYSSCTYCILDYLNFQYIADNYVIYFIEYNHKSKKFEKITQLDTKNSYQENYKNYFEGKGWCNTGFTGQGKCARPKIQRWDIGLGEEIACKEGRCFEIELEIERNRTNKTFGGRIRLTPLEIPANQQNSLSKVESCPLIQLWLKSPKD